MSHGNQRCGACPPPGLRPPAGGAPSGFGALGAAAQLLVQPKIFGLGRSEAEVGGNDITDGTDLGTVSHSLKLTQGGGVLDRLGGSRR